MKKRLPAGMASPLYAMDNLEGREDLVRHDGGQLDSVDEEDDRKGEDQEVRPERNPFVPFLRQPGDEILHLHVVALLHQGQGGADECKPDETDPNQLIRPCEAHVQTIAEEDLDQAEQDHDGQKGPRETRQYFADDLQAFSLPVP